MQVSAPQPGVPSPIHIFNAQAHMVAFCARLRTRCFQAEKTHQRALHYSCSLTDPTSAYLQYASREVYKSSSFLPLGRSHEMALAERIVRQGRLPVPLLTSHSKRHEGSQVGDFEAVLEAMSKSDLAEYVCGGRLAHVIDECHQTSRSEKSSESPS
jgi:hypothetical protein